MSIETPEELEHLKAAGRVVAQAISAMRARACPGISTAELDGFYADACVSVPVGHARPSTPKPAATSRHALNRALKPARAGVPINHMGRVVQSAVAVGS